MPQQQQRMTAKHPQFKLLELKPQVGLWQGLVQPTPLSDIYTIRIRYEKYKGPQVLVIKPALRLREGSVSIPHTYVGNRLCLYYPDYDEWSSDKYLAETIVPWISLWLFYYETWLATGQWLGGGVKHSGDKKQDE